MLITKVPPGIYMSGWMVVWAAVSGTNPPGPSRRVSRSLTPISFDRPRAKLWRVSRMSILPRNYRGACKCCFPFLPAAYRQRDNAGVPYVDRTSLVLPWCNLHSVHLLHTARYVELGNRKGIPMYINRLKQRSPLVLPCCTAPRFSPRDFRVSLPLAYLRVWTVYAV